MEEFRGSSRNVDRGPKECMGSYNPVVSKKEQREIDGALGGASYVGIDVPEDFTTVLYHTGVGRECATERIKIKIRMAWYLKNPNKYCVIRKEYVSLMVGMKSGCVDTEGMEGDGFIVLYTNLEMSGYFTPVILDDGDGCVSHAFVKVQLNDDVPEGEMLESRERKVVCILNEFVELYTKNPKYCMICCNEFTCAPSSLFVNGGVCKMSSCTSCCSDVGRGRKPWQVSEGNLDVLATVASCAPAAFVDGESDSIFDYGNTRSIYGQKKKIYQDSVWASRDNVKIETQLAKKRSLSEKEIENLKKQCRENSRRIVDIQEQLDNFEEGYKEFKAKS